VEEVIDPRLSKFLVPPFSLQPLVENAVEHGLRSSPRPGRLALVARPVGRWLEMSVSDNGAGVSSTKVEQLFFGKCQRVHALALLRRRLQGLFGRSFQLEVRSQMGEGTTVTMRIPLDVCAGRSGRRNGDRREIWNKNSYSYGDRRVASTLPGVWGATIPPKSLMNDSHSYPA
jgi:Histidine kinase-, DNA gyrase B-, and HSP90-like ATPase